MISYCGRGQPAHAVNSTLEQSPGVVILQVLRGKLLKRYRPQAGDEVSTYFRKVAIGRLRSQVRDHIALVPPVEPLPKGNPVRLDKAAPVETSNEFPQAPFGVFF